MTKAKTAARVAPDPGMKAPASLSDEARALWDDLVAAFDFDDRLGRVLLAEALACFDRAREAAAILAVDGLTITTAGGELKRHPMLSVEVSARAQFARLIRELGLTLEVLHPTPGRPRGA